jgi:hypothetical protein
VLPNLIVIGSAKCGTTGLHRYLDLHPEIAMAAAKELDFFAGTQNWQRGVEWYESQFRPATVRGETSPSYTQYPRVAGVPARMAQVVPSARLVYIVRDPIERTISAYRFRRWIIGGERREIDQALASFEQKSSLDSSRYAFQLEQYLE